MTTDQDQATIAELAATNTDLTRALHAAEHRAREAAAAAAEAEREIVVLQDNAKMDRIEIARLQAEVARLENAERVLLTRQRRLDDFDRMSKRP